MKRGFTLVELLAVIVILAVILVIAVPQINSVIRETKKNSLASTAKLLAAKAEEATVENEILENNETLSCADLVKLDDNYGACSVRVTNGVGTVTLVGVGKFAGYTCTGTKSNMSCTESVPEYLYAYDPNYVFTVTDSNACETYSEDNFLDAYINNWGYTSAEAQTVIEKICSNDSDIYDTPSEPYSASKLFEESIKYDYITYEDVEAFVDVSIPNGYVNYEDVKCPNNTTARIFVMASTTNPKDQWSCTTYSGSLVCLEESPSAYSENITKLESIFGTCGGTYTNTAGYEHFDCGDADLEYDIDATTGKINMALSSSFQRSCWN